MKISTKLSMHLTLIGMACASLRTSVPTYKYGVCPNQSYLELQQQRKRGKFKRKR